MTTVLDFEQIDQFQKCLIATASIFHDIYVPRYNNVLVSYVIVPIIFSHNDRLWDIANSNTLINQINDNQIETNYVVPAMSLELSGIEIDNNRKISEISILDNENGIMTPIPIILDLILHIETKKTADLLKILEQILPMFPNKIAIPLNKLNETSIDELIISFENLSVDLPSEMARYDADICSAEISLKVQTKLYRIPRIQLDNLGYEFSIIAKNPLNNEMNILYTENEGNEGD